MPTSTQASAGVESTASAVQPEVVNPATGKFITRHAASDSVHTTDAAAINAAIGRTDTVGTADASSITAAGASITSDSASSSDLAVFSISAPKADAVTAGDSGSAFFDDYALDWAADYAGTTVVW